MAETEAAAPVTEGEPKAEAVVTWRDALPETIRGEKTLDKFAGKDEKEVLGKLAQSYINLEKHAGAAVKIPGPNATPEEKAAFFERLGVPKSPDEYGVTIKVPEGVAWHEGAEKLFLSKMHKQGLTKAQAQGLLEDYLEVAAAEQTRQAQERSRTTEDALEVIKGEWGGLTDRNLAIVQRTVAEFGGEEFKVYLEETGLGNDPRFLKAWHKMAMPLLEGNLIKGKNLGMSRADAKKELQSLMKSPEFLAGDKQVIEKVRDLAELAHGGD